MFRPIRLLATACMMIGFTHHAWPQSDMLDFESATRLTMDDSQAGVERLTSNLAEFFPQGISRQQARDVLQQQIVNVRHYESARSDHVGDTTNIRTCSDVSESTLDCIWFLFVPPDQREEAMDAGIYGMTWVLIFHFASGDSLEQIDIDVLLERL